MHASTKRLVGWAFGASLAFGVAGHAAAAPSNETCEARKNDTPARLLECIQEQPLFDHLVAFQQIADQNPGPGGHGNRNTGTAGYKASVDYVAALMRKAGYTVTIQTYNYADFQLTGVPAFSTDGQGHALYQDWYVARLSGGGTVTARVQPVGGIDIEGALGATRSGCSPADFAGFAPGNIAQIQRGGCALDIKVKNAEAVHASGVILFNNQGASDGDEYRGTPKPGGAYEARLAEMASVPVVGFASFEVGADLYRRYVAQGAPTARLDIQARYNPKALDYNLIADSPFGDPNHVVVVDAHLDSIYGAGILDNASGSSTILEVALKMANTPTRNQLRYIWFGGEEIGLLGSKYYTTTLTPTALNQIVFDIDADVTATPNYAILIADPQNAYNVQRFPPNVVPQSRRGDNYFTRYFKTVGLPSELADGGNDGTDSNSFSLVGVPNTGIFTDQDCCKPQGRVDKWGGFLGNYEGKTPSFNGGCVDHPRRWCDNLDNNAPYVLEFISKAVAYVTFKLANDPALGPGAR